MLVETLVVVPLSCRELAPPPSTWTEGVANWLLEGTWSIPLGEPELGVGGFVARLHAVVKGLDPAARITVADGALEPFEAAGARAAGPDLEAVPPAWTSGLVDGTAHVVLRWEALLAAVTARYASRTRGDVPALRLVVRAVRADLLPEEGEDADYWSELGRALDAPGAFRRLRDHMARDGQRLGEVIGAGFRDLCDAPHEVRSRVRVFERTDGLEDVVRGMPPTVEKHLKVVGMWFEARKPSVEVLRRRKDGGVELWRGDGDHPVR